MEVLYRLLKCQQVGADFQYKTKKPLQFFKAERHDKGRIHISLGQLHDPTQAVFKSDPGFQCLLSSTPL